MTTVPNVERGTVKVGRWSYPAMRNEDGSVLRNTKRDGSGEWDETNPALFVATGEGDPIAEKAAAISVPDAIPGFTPTDDPAPAKGAHGGKVGAQVKKPGKSTWQIGDDCPQGHTLTEETLYVMPSGRKQCRVCRGGYTANSSK